MALTGSLSFNHLDRPPKLTTILKLPGSFNSLFELNVRGNSSRDKWLQPHREPTTCWSGSWGATSTHQRITFQVCFLRTLDLCKGVVKCWSSWQCLANLILLKYSIMDPRAMKVAIGIIPAVHRSWHFRNINGLRQDPSPKAYSITERFKTADGKSYWFL